MKKLFLVVFAALLPAAFADDVNSQILKQLELLQKQVAQQQAEIEGLKAQLNQAPSAAVVSQMVDQAIEQKALAEVKDTGLFTLGENTSNLRLTGDLLLRFQRLEYDADNTDDTDDERFSTRLRLGMVWTNDSESWEVGAGLITGDSINNVLGNNAGLNPVDHNDVWNDTVPFETGDIRLDYAYAKHTWDCVSFAIGQQINPFKDLGILWDSDVRLTGATLAYDIDWMFATIGAYDVYYPRPIIGGNDDTHLDDHAIMYAGQIGFQMEQEDFDASLAASVYWFNERSSELASTYVPIDEDEYDYQIASLLGDINGTFGDVELGLRGQVWYNFGADGNAGESQANTNVDPEDNELGWMAGARAAMGPFGVSYDYIRYEADSGPCLFKDADFGAGLYGDFRDMDVKGHRIMATYNFTQNCWLGGSVMLYETIEAPNDCEGELYQLDLNYRF